MAAVTVAGVWLNCHVTGRSCVCVCELCLHVCLLSERAFKYICVSVLLSAANCSSSERLLRVHFNKGEHAGCNWVASQLKQVVALGQSMHTYVSIFVCMCVFAWGVTCEIN